MTATKSTYKFSIDSIFNTVIRKGTTDIYLLDESTADTLLELTPSNEDLVLLTKYIRECALVIINALKNINKIGISNNDKYKITNDNIEFSVITNSVNIDNINRDTLFDFIEMSLVSGVLLEWWWNKNMKEMIEKYEKEFTENIAGVTFTANEYWREKNSKKFY